MSNATAIEAAPGTAPTPSLPPNQTLYIKNLNPKINKQDLRLALYCLFGTYGTGPSATMLNIGPVLDVVCSKTGGMRGQAHVVFRDVVTATTAMRALHNFMFLDKEMYISYAKGKSDIIAKLDGTFRIRLPEDKQRGTKRVREDDDDDEDSDEESD